MNDEKSIKNTRAEMELAAKESEKTFSDKPKEPGRYKVYDRIKERVSLRTVDAVIIVVSVLLIALLVIGILTGSLMK